MRGVLLGLAAASLAAVLVPAAPAGAQHFSGAGAGSGHDKGPVFDRGDFWSDPRDRDRRDRRRSRGADTVFVYDRDWQGDSAWRSSSFNDWWHDRPDRSYPRWVAGNQNCARQWYAGAILRC